MGVNRDLAPFCRRIVTVGGLMTTIDNQRDTVDMMDTQLWRCVQISLALSVPKKRAPKPMLLSTLRLKLLQAPEHGWVDSQSGFRHRMDRKGAMRALHPPVLSVEQVPELARIFIAPSGQNFPKQHARPALVPQLRLVRQADARNITRSKRTSLSHQETRFRTSATGAETPRSEVRDGLRTG